MKKCSSRARLHVGMEIVKDNLKILSSFVVVFAAFELFLMVNVVVQTMRRNLKMVGF